nr:hypothetical protein [Tanacetum cinerariifolium]
MSWFSRCSWCGGPFNGGNCQHYTNVSFEDEPVYDSNLNSYNQTLDFSTHFHTTATRQTQGPMREQLFKQNFKRFMAQLSCSYCGGIFNGGNCSSCSIILQREQAANLSTHTPEPSRRFNFIFYDDDDEESTIPLNEIVSQMPSSIAIIPVLPNVEPEDCLIIGDEDLSTIPKKESDDVIKSSIEDIVPILSESEDTYGSDSECDLPSCDDFSPIDVLEGKSVTFSNPLFDSNDDFTSSDDESLSDKDVLEDIESKVFYVSNLNKQALLVTPLFDSNEDECFDPGGDSLLSDDTAPNLYPEVFLGHDPRSLSDIIDLKIMVKVFDPGIPEKIISPTYVSLPFKDRHDLSLTYVI